MAKSINVSYDYEGLKGYSRFHEPMVQDILRIVTMAHLHDRRSKTFTCSQEVSSFVIRNSSGEVIDSISEDYQDFTVNITDNGDHLILACTPISS